MLAHVQYSGDKLSGITVQAMLLWEFSEAFGLYCKLLRRGTVRFTWVGLLCQVIPRFAELASLSSQLCSTRSPLGPYAPSVCHHTPYACTICIGRSKGEGASDALPPWASKFFHAVFGKFSQNCMLMPPWGVGAPCSGKSRIRH